MNNLCAKCQETLNLLRYNPPGTGICTWVYTCDTCMINYTSDNVRTQDECMIDWLLERLDIKAFMGDPL